MNSERNLSYTEGNDSVDRFQPRSPQHPGQRLLSEESDALLEAVLTHRNSLMSDPDVQQVLRKSYSLDDLADSNVPVLARSFLLIY